MKFPSGADPLVRAGPPGPALERRYEHAGQGAGCGPGGPPHKKRAQSGFTLLEVLVATLIMGIAVAGVLSGLTTSVRNASRLTQYDRATLLARQKMNELLVDTSTRRGVPVQGTVGPTLGWSAVIQPFEASPGTSPGQWVLDRVQLQVWWMDGPTRHEFSLEGFRRGILQNGDNLNAR